MSYTVKLIQSRPNTSVEFFSPSEQVITELNNYISSGQVISYNLNEVSEDQLTKTGTIVYASSDDYLQLKALKTFVDSSASRSAYCAANLISFSLEVD